ncbi:MAG TPA: arginine--tRNA ligase [Terracidiphilus sp.]|nr:arginine--tRNA ligase [Terracidiphilus sp.]
MYLELQKALAEHIRGVLRARYQLEVENIPVEIPPELKFGELATPIALQLARTLRKAPKIIAQEIVAGLGTVDGFGGFEVAGAGYINARLDRGAVVQAIAGAEGAVAPTAGGHSLVEHTSINPNKAAHIGHLRNAILGDTFVRLLRAVGQKVDVQNYIDNTGVQVADVVVGFLHLERKSLDEIRSFVAALHKSGERIDFYCWDLYARTSQWYEEGSEEENTARKKLRYETLHHIEAGDNDTAAVADLISTAVLRRHLETMLRLDIEYDFLPRESEILHLKFWDAAFEQMKNTGVLYFETEGKNKGCWVMRRPGAATVEGEVDEDAKVIVRSNGTVTYVGKDIAYHLWKFGLLGRDFGYKRFFRYPEHECWISAEQGEEQHPHFGGAQAIYNVIDSRQADPQANVIQALRGMGHTEQADRYTHFSYEMVALTPRCAVELGYNVSEEDLNRPYIEVSGRKGFGVKADDLIDKLIAATHEEVEKRQTSRDPEERQLIAKQIAIGALRYFMLKFTRNSVIAFDFKDALSFEGETGPYCQYAAVRIRNIFRKGNTTPEAELTRLAALTESDRGAIANYLSGDENEDIWALWLRAGKRGMVLDQCIGTSEPAYLAKHAFQLAQDFSNFYHHHHILTEEDPARKTFLLATAAVTLRELVTVLDWMGIESPDAM